MLHPLPEVEEGDLLHMLQVQAEFMFFEERESSMAFGSGSASSNFPIPSGMKEIIAPSSSLEDINDFDPTAAASSSWQSPLIGDE